MPTRKPRTRSRTTGSGVTRFRSAFRTISGGPCLLGLQEGDELWEFRSPRESWANMAGRAGIALVRNGEVVASIVTRMNSREPTILRGTIDVVRFRSPFHGGVPWASTLWLSWRSGFWWRRTPPRGTRSSRNFSKLSRTRREVGNAAIELEIRSQGLLMAGSDTFTHRARRAGQTDRLCAGSVRQREGDHDAQRVCAVQAGSAHSHGGGPRGSRRILSAELAGGVQVMFR